jgi:hypothetical protein
VGWPIDGVATPRLFRRRVWPFGGDDRLELGSDQLGICADDREELLLDRGQTDVIWFRSGGHGVTTWLKR